MDNQRLPRRSFLKTSSLALATTAFSKYIPANYNATAKRVALIGTGWYGKSDLLRLMQVANVEVVGLCDVDGHQLQHAADMIKQRQPKQNPKLFDDYKQLLSEVQPEIVLIGTPDHWHALIAIDAIKAGAHLYLQKPITADVMEGEAILAAARQYNRVVQVGLQRRSTPHLVEAKQKFVDSGLLGKVHYAETCCYYHMRADDNPATQPVPSFFNYDKWTGPAPMRAYDGLPHRRWRAFMEYGNGIMGDMGVHMFDAVRWMLGVGWPAAISSTGGIYVDKASKSNISDTQTALFSFNDFDCAWEHRTWGTASDPKYPWAFKLYGDKGTLSCDVYQYDFTPVDGKPVHGNLLWEKEKYPEDLKEPDIELHVAPATRRHMQNFLSAIDTKTKPVADIEEGHISTASCIMANLSMQLKRPLHYDPVKRIVTGDDEATALLKRQYRDGYVHPAV
jgi:predicted dehydrogenase